MSHDRYVGRSLGGARAFTLIELMVGLGVTAVLVALMLQAVTLLTNAWKRSSGILTTEAQAALILDQVALDLQSALFHRDGGVWLAATVQRSPQPPQGDA